ncbi:MAG TPA: hypothetical protein ENH01_09955, partial [Nitrospirae bacterium]|nr:hypothetical protein [Nitrospirota bacterium]
MAGKRTVYIGTWENRSAPKGSFQEAEEATRKYGVSVVGLTHSRGVNMESIRIRIKDTTLLNLIKKFLKAGYVDDGILVKPDTGTP